MSAPIALMVAKDGAIFFFVSFAGFLRFAE